MILIQHARLHQEKVMQHGTLCQGSLFGQWQRCHSYVLDNRAVEEAQTNNTAVPLLPAFMQAMCSAVQQGVHRLQKSTQSKSVAASS